MLSGQNFEKAADIHQRHLSDPVEAAKMLQDAYKSYKDISPQDATRVLDQSIRIYTAKGNFRRAADLMCDLADVYEKQQNLEKALQCLETAITWYSDENIQATANKSRQKAGQYAAELKQWYKAVTIFTDGAKASLSTGPTGRFIVKTYLFKAGICQLATGDVIGMQNALESYTQLDRGFENEREGRTLRMFVDAMEKQDPEGFAQIARDWDNMTQMENWMVSTLLEAKKTIEKDEAEDEFA